MAKHCKVAHEELNSTLLPTTVALWSVDRAGGSLGGRSYRWKIKPETVDVIWPKKGFVHARGMFLL
jgi:hypothetical protein